MPKKSSMRWSKADKKKVTIMARKFNSKITRLEKSRPGGEEYLPERINVQDFINKVDTRQDFNRMLKSYERFMKKGAEDIILTKKGIHTTKWEKQEVALKVAQINRRRTLERKKADVSTYKGTMGSIESNNLRPKTFNLENIKKRDWEKFKESVEKQVMANYTANKMERYKENYLQCIINNLGESELSKGFYNFIKDIDASTMYNKYYDDPILQIQFISDPLPVNEIIDAVVDRWCKALNFNRDEIDEKYNMNFDDIVYNDIWE